ncbi:hypothetical protein TREMEDRAFT_65341 [Tremella mesenterica DSM 1558]|uniref:uncharacterized protein n=1 Tax=Tremella mesenterica (strain ATCC 24925 / CBS 8224 / DSM 1558 / NBRC 9311 / NRRL Y-6157 / RJB 2259-6 / UBC 559-6) TaxID=578456 RepID=UPI00032BA931|nr:uncharacterized protein TREMEDRAFT_65341 [Tremella mesenterica DSM 1558]EIW66479.1 hypothetical protein TREMEDRAFT_65341 [Tremella mesenterica DSM 1558]
MRVFWPKSIQVETGVVIGWKTPDALLCVITIVSVVPQRVVDHLPTISHKPEVLGEVLNDSEADEDETNDNFKSSGPPTKNDYKSGGRLKMRIGKDGRISTSEPIIVEMICFTPPDPTRLRYLSLRPRGMSNGRGASVDFYGGSIAKTVLTKVEREEQLCRMEMEKQDEYGVASLSSGGIENIIPLLNRTFLAQKEIQALDHNRPSGKPSRFLTFGMELLRPVRLSMLPLRILAGWFVFLSESNMLGRKSGSLRQHSATVEQICLRLGQQSSASEKFKQAMKTDVDVGVRSRDYIVYGSLPDMFRFPLTGKILEYDLAYSKRLNSRIYTSQYVTPLQTSSHNRYPRSLPNDWPVGLKLNTPLSNFFCSTFTSFISQWGNFLTPLLIEYTEKTVDILSLGSLGGLTISSCMISDLLKLLFVHMEGCYWFMSKLCGWQIESLSGLWNLFRGKRWNVLRQRTDSYAYDIDQLFLGSMLFTVSAFLFPTVLTYSALFFTIHLSLVVIQKGLSMAVLALNAFPLFEVMLSFKEPSRLPGGITFALRRPVPSRRSEGLILPHLELKNAPRSLKDIIFRAS